MIEESGCQVHPGLPQGPATWTRDEAKKRATVGLAARGESDSGSGRAGREDAGGDGNGTRRGAVEGRSAIWCVPGTAGGRGRLVRRLVQAGQAGDAGRDAGARRSAKPPVGPVSRTKYGLGRGAPPEPAGTAPGLPAGAPALVAPPAPAAPAPVPSDGPAPAPPATPTPVAPVAPGPAEPVAPVPPEAPAEPPVGPTPAASAVPPGPAAPVPLGQAPPEPVVAGVPPAPAARLQRRANHSRSSCGERTSRRDETPREATQADPAPPGSAPPSSVTPGSAPPGSVLVQPYGLHSACCPCACMRVCMEWYEGMR
ncbi:unnamed protein product [Closterium sp. NIES-53]